MARNRELIERLEALEAEVAQLRKQLATNASKARTASTKKDSQSTGGPTTVTFTDE